ncbi:MAG: hypothetical protein AB8B69_18065 [Chitinophagales bacterium]
MIQLGYIGLSITMATIIVLGYNHTLTQIGMDGSLRKKKVWTAGIGLFLWLAYAAILGKSGFLQNFDFPPRFPLLLILPAFIFTGVLLSRHHDSPVIAAIPKSWLIYYQTFRIVIESLFVATVSIGVLHPEVTFEGYNYDIVFAFTAPFVAYLVFNKKLLPQKFALAWNYLGLAVIAFIIFLFTTTTYFPSVWGSAETLANKEFITFPYVFVPAFLMPSAVFMHIVSIIQLTKSKES